MGAPLINLKQEITKIDLSAATCSTKDNSKESSKESSNGTYLNYETSPSSEVDYGNVLR